MFFEYVRYDFRNTHARTHTHTHTHSLTDNKLINAAIDIFEYIFSFQNLTKFSTAFAYFFSGKFSQLLFDLFFWNWNRFEFWAPVDMPGAGARQTEWTVCQQRRDVNEKPPTAAVLATTKRTPYEIFTNKISKMFKSFSARRRRELAAAFWPLWWEAPWWTGLNIRFLNVLNTVGHIGRPMLWKVKHAGWENVREEQVVQVGGEVFPHNWQMTHNQCADAVWN